MLRLTMLLHGMIGTILAGVGVVVGLIAGMTSLWPLLGAACVGYVAGLPVAWGIARKIHD